MLSIKQIFRRLTEKDIIVIKNVFAAFVIKGLALLISLFTMPAYIRYFDDQRILGVWYTILSVLTWILSFDLGIGNGLRNHLSASIARKDLSSSQGYISSAYWMIGIIVMLTSLVGLIIIPFCNWNSVFNISAELIDRESLASSMRLVFVGIMLQFFLRLISSVIYAIQRSALNNVISLITSLLLLAFASLAPKGSSVENLKMFAVAYIVCSNLPLLVTTIIIFCGPLKKCRPSFHHISKEKSKKVMMLGGIFFICQILYMLISNTNEFFVSQYTGPENVVDYQIYYRLFSLGSMVFMLALSPIWSIVSKAIAENDITWLKNLYRKIRLLSWIGVFCEFLLIIPLQFIINIWLKDDAIQVNYGYAFIFALFGSAMLYQSALSTIVNGMGKMKLQAICYGVGIVLKFIIIHVGIKWTGSWAVVVLANAVILIPYCFLQQMSLNKYFYKKEE